MEIAFEMKNIVSFLWLLPYISRRLKYKMHKYLGFPCLVQNVITILNIQLRGNHTLAHVRFPYAWKDIYAQILVVCLKRHKGFEN